MGWVHDTGYGPAYVHTGSVVAILDDGSEHLTSDFGPRVTAWRAGCSCGWRGGVIHRRADYPDDHYAVTQGMAPPAVHGFPEADEDPGAPVGDGLSCYQEWDAHLHAVVPELVVRDASEAHREALERIERAVETARREGASWGAIGEAAGVSRQAAWERWRHLESAVPDARQRLDVVPAEVAAGDRFLHGGERWVVTGAPFSRPDAERGDDPELPPVVVVPARDSEGEEVELSLSPDCALTIDS